MADTLQTILGVIVLLSGVAGFVYGLFVWLRVLVIIAGRVTGILFLAFFEGLFGARRHD